MRKINTIKNLRFEKKTDKSDDSHEELQAELLRLQRQYRFLEEDRRNYREETEYVLKKQRDSIESLNMEHDDLKTDYTLSDSVKNKSFDRNNVIRLQELLYDEESVKVEMAATVDLNGEVNRKTKAIKQAMDAFRKRIGGCSASRLRCKSVSKQNGVMENRLNEANIKFNKALAKNKKLREEINHINVQRTRFIELQQKLHKLLLKGKQDKNKLIEQSTLLFNSHDEAEHRMQSLRERSERDMNTFNSELKDLQRIINHDRKLREFMNTKMEERSEIYESTVNGRKEKELLSYAKALEVKLQHYESIFNELVNVSGNTDIDGMVEKFIQIEDRNFALFNFVKEQSSEIQASGSDIESLKHQITSMHEKDVHLESKLEAIKKSLEEKETHFIQCNVYVNNQLKSDQKSLDSICSKIETMLNKVRCDRSAMTELLAGSNITHDNLTAYLGLIEQKGSEMLQARSLLQLRKTDESVLPGAINNNKDDTEQATEMPISFKTVGKIARYLLRMPLMADDISDTPTQSGSVQEALYPLTQLEVRSLLVSRLARRSARNSARLESKRSTTK